MSSSTNAALSYHEPSIETILILTSFLLLLNIVNYVLDKRIYCGLIGQILIGIAWGLPGAKWLALEVQNTVMQVGYLGLILIVYEGEQFPHTVFEVLALLMLMYIKAVSQQTSKSSAPISLSPAWSPQLASQHPSLSPSYSFPSSMPLHSKHSPPAQRCARPRLARLSRFCPRVG